MKKNYVAKAKERRFVLTNLTMIFILLLHLKVLGAEIDKKFDKEDAPITVTFTVGGTWSPAPPGVSDDVIIEGDLELSGIWTGDYTINSLTIEAGGSVTIPDSNSSVTITGDLIQNGTLSLLDGASMIIGGTVSGTGTTTYTRTEITNNRWYIISPPTTEETVSNIITNHPFLATGTGGNLGLGAFSNNDGWNYFNASSTGAIAPGTGLTLRLSGVVGDPLEVIMTGSFTAGDVAIEICQGTENDFNLIGNPYPSTIGLNADSGTTSNILEHNLDILEEATIWIWLHQEGTWELFNLATIFNNYQIPSLQGFFVKMKSDYEVGGVPQDRADFQFTRDMQGTRIRDDFFRPNSTENVSSRPEIKLSMTDANDTKRHFDIFYIEGTTTGFDNGYDSTLFGSGDQSYQIYTHLVSDNQGEKYGIQSLPNSDYETMVVSIGIDAAVGSQLALLPEVKNFPAGINVYLEDKLTNEFINLSELDGSHEITVTQELQGVGRFYIHTTSNILNTFDFDVNRISMYQSHETHLTITGIPSGNSEFVLYDIQGREILRDSFEGNQMNHIALRKNLQGIFFAKVSTPEGIVKRKIILE